MRQIRLILDTNNNSIGYLIDAEKMTYSCGEFDQHGQLIKAEESGEILDSAVLAKRLYLVIKAALEETVVPSEVSSAS